MLPSITPGPAQTRLDRELTRDYLTAEASIALAALQTGVSTGLMFFIFGVAAYGSDPSRLPTVCITLSVGCLAVSVLACKKLAAIGKALKHV